MKAVFEFDFPSASDAKKARVVLEQKGAKREVASFKLAGSTLVAAVHDESFAKLRAKTVSLLRCAKIVFDVVALAEKERQK